MKLQLVYVASLMEELGMMQEQIDTPDSIRTVADLFRHLSSIGKDALLGANIHCALNGRVCSGESVLKEGDELTFFPPIIGG